VVRSQAARARLAEAVHQGWATKAPVVIVVCADTRPCQARYGDRGSALYAIQDTAAAVENVLLAAVDRGLSSCWIGAFDEAAVSMAIGAGPQVLRSPSFRWAIARSPRAGRRGGRWPR